MENRATVAIQNQNDGHIEVVFSDNDIEARGDFYPPLGSGQPITSDYIDTLLERLKLVYGVNRDAIIEAAMKCTKERRVIKDILIAKGDPPVPEILEYVQLNPLLGQNVPAGDGQIDYRSRSPFIIVKKDQALAKQKSRKPGKDGKNVHGAAVPHETVRPEGVTGGGNTRMEGRLLLSNINGQLVLSKDVVSVSDSLTIKGPVGYKTGNIIFPGDVAIEGPVSDGFKIYSGGSVTIKQTFDVTDSITKGDLCVAGGIIGRGRALVKVGGCLKTKFIENCKAACRKTITVDSEIINSHIFTLENLEMGDKGMILGGEIYAVKGIRAHGIGKKSGKATHIHCGVDFTAEQEREKNNNILRLTAAKLERIKSIMAMESSEAVSGEKRAKLEELTRRLEDEQKKAQAAVTELMGRIVIDNHATVEVTGEIAAGTLIEICQVALFVSEPLRKVRIRLDTENGKLISEGL
jgi:uncharacterized protein (DUF342 family)